MIGLMANGAGSIREINSAADLLALAEEVNSGTSYAGITITLKADIDLSAYGTGNTGFNGGKGWIPIGKSGYPFQGIFDGGGMEINGLTINDTANSLVGLFGIMSTSGETKCGVKNLNVTGANITGKDNVGGIVGNIGNGQLNNCQITGTVTGAAYTGYSLGYTGGIAGCAYESDITDCRSQAAVSGSTQVAAGGIAGQVLTQSSNSPSIKGCQVSGTVQSTTGSAGGIAGSTNGIDAVYNVNITGCWVTGAVSSTSSGNVGGCHPKYRW